MGRTGGAGDAQRGERKAEGQRFAKLREAAGLTQPEAALRLGMDPVTLSRKERGVSAITAGQRLAMESLYGAGGSAADASEPGAGGSPPVPEEQSSPLYWRGRQDECVRTMEYISQSLRQAIAAHDRTLATQREIIANTTPQPRPSAVISGGTPQQRPAERTKRAAKRRPG